MSGWQSRYWLIKRGRVGLEEGEAPMKDFVSKDFVSKDFMCCKVPVGENFARALEVFTSQEGAEAEVQGIESLDWTKYLRMAATYRKDMWRGV